MPVTDNLQSVMDRQAWGEQPMTATFDEKSFRLLFRISLLLKGAFSLLEIVGGILAYYVSQQYLLQLVTTITQEELTEDPHDFVAHFLIQSAQQLSVSAQHFAAFYLLSHGIIKTFLIVGLLREKLGTTRSQCWCSEHSSHINSSGFRLRIPYG